MINEFYLGLLNQMATNHSPGHDYVPPQWVARQQSASALSIRQSLLGSVSLADSANWRALEIRRAARRCDLAGMLTRLDSREAYELSDLQKEMADRFRPVIFGDPTASVRVTGQLKGNYYRIYNWDFVSRTGGFDIHGPSRTDKLEIADGQSHVTYVVPGSDARVIIPSNAPTFQVRWASRPTTSFADTANQLKHSLQGPITTLAGLPSKFDTEDKSLLRRIVLHNDEAVAQVVAAALLLVGNTLASPPMGASIVAA